MLAFVDKITGTQKFRITFGRHGVQQITPRSFTTYDLIENDAKREDVTFLGPTQRGIVVAQQFGSFPQKAFATLHFHAGFMTGSYIQ
jgi:hypothetical protein